MVSGWRGTAELGEQRFVLLLLTILQGSYHSGREITESSNGLGWKGPLKVI